jgi:CSLREA domain-containing protein
LRRRRLLAVLALAALWGAARGAGATTLVVTKPDDTNDHVCDADCSLREAIDTAHPGDTISFSPDVRGTSTLTLGDLVIDQPVTIVGPGQSLLTISGGDTQRIFTITPAGALTASGLTFAHGKGSYYAPLAVNAAGAVLASGAFAFTDCTFADNHSDGVFNQQFVNDAGVAYSDANGKSISFTRCTFIGNTAGGGACLDIDYGALTITDCVFADNDGPFGPACVIGNSGTPLTITGTAFYGNTARAGAALFISGAAEATVENTTITGNTATAGFGAGIYVYGPGSITLDNVTLASNTAGTAGANLYLTNGGGAVLANTILADTPNNCGGTTAVVSHGYNLDTGTTCALAGAGDMSATPSGLAPLTASGGLIPTMPLYTNSAALDGGNPATPGGGGSACLAEDQRGVARPQFSRCDIGAFETTGPETIGTTGFFDAADGDIYSWPAQPGVTQYEARRSSSPTFPSPCAGITTTGLSWRDAVHPAPGFGFYYLTRPIAPLLGSWGFDSAGVERTMVCP